MEDSETEAEAAIVAHDLRENGLIYNYKEDLSDMDNDSELEESISDSDIESLKSCLDQKNDEDEIREVALENNEADQHWCNAPIIHFYAFSSRLKKKIPRPEKNITGICTTCKIEVWASIYYNELVTLSKGDSFFV